MSQKKVSFKTVDGYTIVGSHTASKGKSIVLWLHGITVHKDEYLNLFKDGSDYLAGKGIDSLRIDFRGHGKSNGKPSIFTITGQMMDVEAALKFINEKYKNKKTSIHVVGCSFGSPPAIYLANKYSDLISSVTLIAPVLSYKKTFLEPKTEWGQELFNEKTLLKLQKTNKLYFNPKFAVSTQFVKEMELFDPEKLVKESRKSITIIHGDEDSLVPYSVSKQVSQKYRNVKLISMPQMDHGFNDIDDEEGNTAKSLANKKRIFEIITEKCFVMYPEVKIIGEYKIDQSVIIHPGSIIGKPFRRFLDGQIEELELTKIDKEVYIGYNCIIGTGSLISAGAIIDDKATIESRVKIGEKTLVIYSSHICNDAEIGNNCVIGGFIGERTKVGNQCRVFGQIVHNQQDPLKGWDDEGSVEDAVIIKDKVFIGFNSVIAGNITIGPRVYITAGSIVTKNVPEGHIVTGKNEMVHFKDWRGKLKDSNLFKE